jgi:hypothetical protein
MNRSQRQYRHTLMMDRACDAFQIRRTYNMVSLFLLGAPAQEFPKGSELILGTVHPNDILFAQTHQSLTDMQAAVQKLMPFFDWPYAALAGDNGCGTRLETHDNSFVNRGPNF